MIEIKYTDDITTRRIKACINNSGYKDQKEFCESFDPKFNESLLSDIFSEKRRTFSNMKMLAEKFDCSLDYLFGLSQVKKREWDDFDRSINLISSKTGISEQALRILSDKKRKNYLWAINQIFESTDFDRFLISLKDYFEYCPFTPENKNTKLGNHILSPLEQDDILLSLVSTIIREIKENSLVYFRAMVSALKEYEKLISSETKGDKVSSKDVMNKLDKLELSIHLHSFLERNGYKPKGGSNGKN